MTSKTISVSEEVYNLLKKMKLEKESFSQTIRRLLKDRKISDCAGLWSDLPDTAIEEIKAGVMEIKRLVSLEAEKIEGR